MFELGLLEEVRNLPELGPTASQAIGIKEAQACIAGEISHEEAISRIRQATRNYAKRQMTWFKRESHFEPIDAGAKNAPESISRELRKFFCK
jgi:tRNA dimethylallyltransferase